MGAGEGSVVDAELWVPTKNSQDTLHATLASARALQPEPERIRIVDGGSSDDTEAIAESFDVDVIDQGDARGASGGRNVALERTDTEYIAYIDDDVQPRPDWLGTLIEELDRTGAGAATAPIRHYPSTVTESWAVKRMPLEVSSDGREATGIPGANGVYRVSAVERVGGWNAADYPFGGEDIDLSRRLRESHDIRYVPETCVVHVPDGGVGALFKLWRWHSEGRTPDSAPELLLRAAEHVGKSLLYLGIDARDRDIELLPLDLLVGLLHICWELEEYRNPATE